MAGLGDIPSQLNETDIKSMKLAELKDYCRVNKLKTTGNKNDLVLRVLEHNVVNSIHQLESEISNIQQKLDTSWSKITTSNVSNSTPLVKQFASSHDESVPRVLTSQVQTHSQSLRPTPAPRLSLIKSPPIPTPKPRPHSRVISPQFSVDPIIGKYDCDIASSRPFMTSPLQSCNLNEVEPPPVHSKVYLPHSPTPTVEHINAFENLLERFSQHLESTKFPTPEPRIFSGDLLQFNDWLREFNVLIKRLGHQSDSDCMFLLRRYLSGEALEAVEGFISSETSPCFPDALQLIVDRYGDPFIVSEAFRMKLETWAKIPKSDARALRALVDFLIKCKANSGNPYMDFLNNCRTNQQILTLLPEGLVVKWNEKVLKYRAKGKGFPSFPVFVEFLKLQSQAASNPITSLEAIKKLSKSQSAQSLSLARNSTALLTGSLAQSSEPLHEHAISCCMCKAPHPVFRCPQFKALAVDDRLNVARNNKLCFNCLNVGHFSRDCLKSLTCATCQLKHNTLLHKLGQEVNSSNCSRVCIEDSRSIMLSTMIVPVWVSSCDNPQRECLTYAMLDTQSDSTFITDELADVLEAKTKAVTLKLSTLTSLRQVVKCRKLDSLIVRGYDETPRISIPSCYSRVSIPHNPNHIPSPLVAKLYPHLAPLDNILPPKLECKIGLLIGYNCPQALAPLKVITADDLTQPYAVQTILGWSVVGQVISPSPCCEDEIGVSHQLMTKAISPQLKVESSIRKNQVVMFVHRVSTTELKVDVGQVVQMLEGDFTPDRDESKESQEDRLFMQIVTQGIKQTDDGHYEMPLPFKEHTPSLPNNRCLALSRFRSLETKLSKNPTLKFLYEAFMNDLLISGEAELVTANMCSEEVWYLPHHGVLNPNKPGKVRVVFDGSSKYQGFSLNDCLLQGPDLNNSLTGVLLRFRERPVVISCDIAKMFHQFKVAKGYRNFLRFLWYHPSDSSRVVDYRMTVHVFGAASSPNCAKFGLLQVAKDHAKDNQLVSQFIQQNFYVDDGLESCANVESAIKLLSDTKQVCAKAGLKLHKLLSNRCEVLAAFPSEDCGINFDSISPLGDKNAILERVLGMQWSVNADCLLFKDRTQSSDTPTRRRILSTLAAIFDPLGLISPIVLVGRIIFQRTTSGLDWDHQLPPYLLQQWLCWLSQLSSLSLVAFPRCLVPVDWDINSISQIEVHTFCDASESGYGICCYSRAVYQGGEVCCRLLCGKSRVVPAKKQLTIPRLELQAAVLAAKMGTGIVKELRRCDKAIFYSDSKIVLAYISNDTKRFHTFVANRVAQIRALTTISQWKFVNGENNPADHASRGLTPHAMIESNWITGPEFLWCADMPCANEYYSLPDNDPELKAVPNVLCNTTKAAEQPFIIQLLDRYSSWSLALGLTSALYMAKQRWKTCTSAVELRMAAEAWLLSSLQSWHFPHDYSSLISKGHVAKCSPLSKLDPYLDHDRVMRVGGRMRFANLTEGAKHPVILPRSAHVTVLLARCFHLRVAHQGRSTTLSALRQNGYWIVGGSRLVSSLISNCVVCRILRRPPEIQKMSNLPQSRTEPSPPFSYTGCDCFGPFIVKDGRKEVKKYGLIFTCLASRAVHLELIDDLSTDAFINGLRTFIALRGNVRQLRCDRGTNFVGAANEMRNAFDEIVSCSEVKQFLLKRNCDFVFNVSGGSHYGGCWERLIRSVRNILQGVLLEGHGRMDTSSTRTLMYEAMSVVNSRPLTTETDHSEEPLTPNHLVLMKNEAVLPPPGNFEPVDMYSRKRWRRTQYLIDLFWKRWRKQYLLLLQNRSKWHHSKRNVSVGDIVVLKEGLFRSDWRLGRVVAVYASADGHVRSVKLKCGSSNLDRPITKMVVLVEAEKTASNQCDQPK